MDDTKRILRETLPNGPAVPAADYLALRTGISKARIKDAMNKGAVWVQRGKKRQRLRRATSMLAAGDRIELYYDEDVLARHVSVPILVHDAKHYSVWNKPAGMLTQGTEYGDHCSLLRQVELSFRMKREAYPVHRLDREASGLVLVAHTKQAAAKLSELFQKQAVEKVYQVVVLGVAGSPGKSGTIDHPLDGRNARTHYTVESVDVNSGISTLSVKIETGRLHQIRRHFAMIGYPVMGDPKYGQGNKNTDGLQLRAISLAFPCPFAGCRVTFSLIS